MDFMKTLNDKGGEKGRKTVDKLNQSIEGYRDRVFAANAMTEENNRIGAYASFGSESIADIYIPTDDYRKWYDYQTLLKKTDSQIQQEKKKILRMGGIFKLTEKQQKDYINKKKKEYESEYGNIDNESYASAYRGGSGSSGSSKSIKSSTGTETRTDDFFDTIYGKPNKKIKLSIDPEERKNAKIEKYVKSKRGFVS